MILIKDLEEMQKQNCKSLNQIRARLQLREAASKVVSAIKSKATDKITGDDMSRLMKLISTKDAYANKKDIT